jgi:uncharacterized protein (DUF4415 family)
MGLGVVFEWDERKRQLNLRKHGLDFADCALELFLCEKRLHMKKKASSKIRSKTDWKRIDAMRDADIDFSDDPEWTPEMFARAVRRVGLKPVLRKSQITLRLDADVLEWFRARGSGYQTQINSLLRAYMEAHLTQR